MFAQLVLASLDTFARYPQIYIGCHLPIISLHEKPLTSGRPQGRCGFLSREADDEGNQALDFLGLAVS